MQNTRAQRQIRRTRALCVPVWQDEEAARWRPVTHPDTINLRLLRSLRTGAEIRQRFTDNRRRRMKSSLDTLRPSDCQMQFRFDVTSCLNRKRDSFYWRALFPAPVVPQKLLCCFSKPSLRRAAMCIILKSAIVVLLVAFYLECAQHHRFLTFKKKVI